jgi:hypothetical protein
MKLLKPDATFEGNIIFNFQNGDSIISIIKEVADYKKATLKAAKDAAVTEAKAKAKEEKKDRKTALAALVSAGIEAEDIAD